MIKKNDLIYVAGHKGLLGSAITKVNKKKFRNILTIEKKLNLINQKETFQFLKEKNLN